MGDLTIVTMQMCRSNEEWETLVLGENGPYRVRFGYTPRGQYQHDYSCSCKGFQFRGKCKHIESARDLRCGWHEQFDSGEVIDGKCPRCGGETVVINVGV